MRLGRLLIAALIISSGLWSGGLYAGGPANVESVKNSGIPLRWKDNTLEWYTDPGRLSSQVDNVTGAQWVKDLFDKWEAVKLSNVDNEMVSTTAFKAVYKGAVSADITKTNYIPFLSPTSSETRTVIIFDSNGDIVADMYGEEARTGFAGLTACVLPDGPDLHCQRGFSLVNGALLDSSTLGADPAARQEKLKASMLHELGHLMNLDHTQVNEDIASDCDADLSKPCPLGNYIPTMYPHLVTATQGVLHRDDEVTVSWLYPSDAFTSDFCTITGEIFDINKKPLKGVNVIARRYNEGDTETRVDARSFVSGALRQGCTGDSRYYLFGLIPNHRYQVTYEALNPEWVAASSIEPLDPPLTGFKGGIILPPSEELSVYCDGGGQTIEMAALQINDATNPCSDQDTSSTPPPGGGSSKCSLSPDVDYSPISVLCLMVAIAAIIFRRQGWTTR